MYYTTKSCGDDLDEVMGGCSILCGGNYTGMSGMINSPRHSEPFPYYTARDCIYQISEPSGINIQITISKININCDYFGERLSSGLNQATDKTDYLEMRDGESAESPIMLRYCGSGNNIPMAMQTTQSFLWIRHNFK